MNLDAQTGQAVITNAAAAKEKATERVTFRLTPRQAILVRQMVGELVKLNRAHNTTDAFLWLTANWSSIEKAKSALEYWRLSEQNREQAILLAKALE